MNNRLQILVGFFSLVLLVAGGYWIVIQLMEFVSDLDKSVLAALLTAIGLAGTAMVVKHLEHKHTVEAGFRDEKVKMYMGLLSEIDKLSSNDSEQKADGDLVQYLKEWQRKLMFVGGPKVLRSYIALRRNMGGGETIGDLGRMLESMGSLLLSMRRDLGLSNLGVDKKKFAAQIMLRHPDIFLSTLKSDPSMKQSEYVEVERRLDEQLGVHSSSPQQRR